ncbi:MAG: pilus assembly protein [Planctomycetaceae bacterium]|nr:pilus assembly protein [Planctomycetaceae bacterium]
MQRTSSTRRPTRSEHRLGAVTVEFALVAPMVFFIVFAAIEFARLNMLVNSMENACYEAARRGIIPGATVANVEAEANQILQAVGAVNSTVTVTPAVITNQTPEITVRISIPLNDNAWVTPNFTKNLVVGRSCTLTREITPF